MSGVVISVLSILLAASWLTQIVQGGVLRDWRINEKCESTDTWLDPNKP